MKVDLARKRCWIIGASSGIGAALADELARRGARVAISARRASRLEDVARGRMLVAPCDVTDTAQVGEATRAVYEHFGAVDVFVWCAGTWRRTDAANWDRDGFAEHVAVNLLGMNNALAHVIPRMVEAGAGQIVGIASVAGYRGLAGSEAYGATKAAQLNLLESLRASLGPRGVAVTTVAPGFVRTELTEGNDFPMPFLIDADEAARSIADGLERDRREVVFPFRMAALMKTAQRMPNRAWDRVASRLAGGSR